MNEIGPFLPLDTNQPRFGGSKGAIGRKSKILALRIFLAAIGTFAYPGAKAQTLDWVKQTGGSGQDSANSIALDAWGNAYLTGSYQDTVDFDPGSGVVEVKSNGVEDIFIQKLDSNGKLIWAKHVGGAYSDHGRTIATDKAGNTYTIGSFRGSVDFDPGTGTAHLTAAGEDDIFILKLDKSGNYIWAKRMGGSGSETGYSLAIDAAGNIYSTGYFSDTADFDPGPEVVNLTSKGGHEIYINKLDGTGNFKWAKSIGSSNDDWGISIFADVDGDVYTTGHFDLTVDFNPGGSTWQLGSFGDADVFVLKLDSLGNFKWVQQMGGNSHDQGRSIVVDGQKNVYITGSFETTADFDPGTGTFLISSKGSRDIFVQKLDASGKNLWVATIAGTQLMRGNSHCCGFIRQCLHNWPVQRHCGL